ARSFLRCREAFLPALSGKRGEGPDVGEPMRGMKRGRSTGAFQSRGIYDSERLCVGATRGPIGNSRRRGSIGATLGISSSSASSLTALIDVHPYIQYLRIWPSRQ